MIYHNYLKNLERQTEYRKKMMKNVIIKVNQFIEIGLLRLFILYTIINIVMILIKHIGEVDFINFIWQNYINHIKNSIFTANSRDFLINVLSILSGFVITIISVFGIGYSKATIKICEEGLEEKFCKIAKEIMYVSIVLLAIIIFIYNITNNEICSIILLLALIFVVIRFIVFSVVVIKMFDYNMKNAKQEYEENEKQTEKIIELLEKIAKEEENIGDYENSKAYSEKTRKQ